MSIITCQSFESHNKEVVTEKLYSLAVGFSLQEEELRFRLRLGRSMPGQSSNEGTILLSHFPSRRTAGNRLGRQLCRGL